MTRGAETPQPQSPQVELAHNLTMDTLHDRLKGSPLRDRLLGSVLLLKGKEGREIINFEPRDSTTATPGFFHWREGGTGESIDNSGVVFKRNGSLIIVHPGPNPETVAGIKITKKGRIREFSGSRASFGRKVLEAKDRAHDNIPGISSHRSSPRS